MIRDLIRPLVTDPAIGAIMSGVSLAITRTAEFFELLYYCNTYGVNKLLQLFNPLLSNASGGKYFILADLSHLQFDNKVLGETLFVVRPIRQLCNHIFAVILIAWKRYLLKYFSPAFKYRVVVLKIDELRFGIV